MKTTTIIGGAVALAVAGYIAFAMTTSNGPMGGMDHSTMGGAATTSAPESTKAYETAMAAMMKGMMTAPTGKPDLDFVQGMIPHHQGAIDMAKVVLQFGKDAEIKKLAEGVIKAQESEIAVMKDWLAKADQAALSTAPDSVKVNEQAMSVMMKNMMVPYTGNADVDFVKGMIPHHQGAIDMGKAALQFAKDPVILKLAQEVVTAQTGEIEFMNGWLKTNSQ